MRVVAAAGVAVQLEGAVGGRRAGVADGDGQVVDRRVLAPRCPLTGSRTVVGSEGRGVGEGTGAGGDAETAEGGVADGGWVTAEGGVADGG